MAPRVGVVGHVEWVEFAPVDHVPRPGEIIHADDPFEAAAGGGAVAAVQLRKLAGAAAFYTALGDDEPGRRARAELAGPQRLELHAAHREREQRRAFTHLDRHGERTITVLGARLVPHGDDPLPWDELRRFDAIYFTGGDVAALEAARAARVLVATPRAMATLEASDVQLDVLVGSATDPGERFAAGELDPPPRWIVRTRGKDGGVWEGARGRSGAWQAVEPPGPPVDAYGCGDSFAAGLTYGLGAGMGLDAALELGARCGAWCLAGRGPYGNQLTLVE
jgi:ribokinase